MVMEQSERGKENSLAEDVGEREKYGRGRGRGRKRICVNDEQKTQPIHKQ
jgi:hypothetical protein